ncbi:hypothetical protein BY996DRAFT_8696954 [Phakopsora pachyrhizi]|nr:hypothetical protein BY996DRAFT_8696954 [Phakopsora pachyrhizi]
MIRIFFCLFYVSVTSLFSNTFALFVTQPDGGTTWSLQSPNVVEWQRVITDPDTIEIKLVNNNAASFGTGFSKTIKDGVNTEDNKTTIESLPGCKAAHGYQINIMSSGNILAQSAQFSINGTTVTNSTASTPHLSTPTVSEPNLSTAAPVVAASSDANTLTLPERQLSEVSIGMTVLLVVVAWCMS